MESITPFLLAHGERFESLLIGQYRSIPPIENVAVLGASLWSTCPNLKIFGCMAFGINLLDVPSPNHPLNYLRLDILHWVYESNTPDSEPRIKVMLKTIRKFKLKYLSTEFGRLREDERKELEAFCQEKKLF